MIQTLKKQFETLKRNIDQIKIQTITDTREKEKIQQEINQIKQKIKNQFGVDPDFFQEQILKIQKQLLQKKQQLKKKVLQAKQKIK